ncbi:rod shape-determining protein RodA [Candidatus Nomurabacteria bacterium]|nr:rod shape-determining protein RodA [Candidatus Nomurabacteria bacterium]
MFPHTDTNTLDWWLIAPALAITLAGVVTMMSFVGNNGFAVRQLVFTLVGMLVAFGISFIDLRIIKESRWFIVILYGIGILLLLGLFGLGATFNGAKSWYSLGPISFQPADFVKIILILILAKYLSRRHIEIARIKHIVVTGIYFFIPFALIVLQPDFGSAMIFLAIWLGMLFASGLTRRHIVFFAVLAAVAGGILWGFVFQDYQKARIISFVNPQADILGAGYNSYQSMITVGSGQWLGKGVGYGTQSRLQFLPEHETDFVFASFAEEWGFVGSVLLLVLFVIMLSRIIMRARYASSNFSRFVLIGGALYLGTHIFLNIGMNVGLLPVTGVPLPFMSYGGSHLLVEWIFLGMVLAIERYDMRRAHPHDMRHEFEGLGSA